MLLAWQKSILKFNFVQRIGISDVCRSVAEANMGGGFCIKAVTRYAVLYDVCFSFCLA
jgi:hypothetical protein